MVQNGDKVRWVEIVGAACVVGGHGLLRPGFGGRIVNVHVCGIGAVRREHVDGVQELCEVGGSQCCWAEISRQTGAPARGSRWCSCRRRAWGLSAVAAGSEIDTYGRPEAVISVAGVAGGNVSWVDTVGAALTGPGGLLAGGVVLAVDAKDEEVEVGVHGDARRGRDIAGEEKSGEGGDDERKHGCGGREQESRRHANDRLGISPSPMLCSI